MDEVTITGAQALVRSLEQVGADVVFGIPGGAILPAYDPLYDSTKVRHILVRHEQGAGHAAEGYAQATGKVGVCMATSGPGATNLVTPIADAYMDSVPMVAITGQVGRRSSARTRSRRPTSPGSRCRSRSTTSSCSRADDVAPAIAEAFHLASTGRPGPVLVDVPKDVLQERTDLRLAAAHRPARLPPGDPPARQAGPRGRQADRRRPAPGALRRRRRAQGAARPRSCGSSPSSPASRSSPP